MLRTSASGTAESRASDARRRICSGIVALSRSSIESRSITLSISARSSDDKPRWRSRNCSRSKTCGMVRLLNRDLCAPPLSFVPESFTREGFPRRRGTSPFFPALPVRSVLGPERFRGGCSFGDHCTGCVMMLSQTGYSNPQSTSWATALSAPSD